MKHPTKSFTTGQAAQAFHVSLKTIQQWVDRGLLECWKTPGGHRRIAPDSIAALKARLSTWPLSRLRILLACKDPQRAALCMATLHRIDPEHTMHHVGSGPHALLELIRVRPNLLICDLPLSGVELDAMIAAIRQDRELSGTRIVLLCDNPDTLHVRLGKLATCIEKSAAPEWLLNQFQQSIAVDTALLGSAS